MFDTVIIILAVISFINGVSKGFVREVAGLAALLLGVYGAARFSSVTEEIITPYLGGFPTRLIAFAITLCLIVVLIRFIAMVATRMLGMMSLSIPNRILGGVASTAKTIFLVSCVLGLVNRFWPGGLFSEEEKDEMVTYRYVEAFSGFVFPYIDQGMEAVGKMKDKIDDAAKEVRENGINGLPIGSQNNAQNNSSDKNSEQEGEF